MPDLEVPVQRIRRFVMDHILEPDAMRGSEHFLRNITDGDGKPISPVDEEEARRQFQADAVQTRAPMRVSSPQSSQTEAPAIPVMETPSSSPNIQRAPMVVESSARTPAVVTDPGVDWQSKARAEGWAPRGGNDPHTLSEERGAPRSDTPQETEPMFRPSPGETTIASDTAPDTAPPPSL